VQAQVPGSGLDVKQPLIRHLDESNRSADHFNTSAMLDSSPVDETTDNRPTLATRRGPIVEPRPFKTIAGFSSLNRFSRRVDF